MRLEKEKTLFVGFTSTYGGVGTSSTAVVFARLAAKLWKKNILVISFDGISSKMAPVTCGDVYAKSLFVNLRSGKNASEELTSFLSRDEFGVSYITDAGFFNPLPELSSDDLYFCMNKIDESGDFDAVVLDFSFRNIRAVELASLCEKIVFCRSRSCTGTADTEDFRRHYSMFAEEMSEKPELLFFAALEDRESFSEGVVDIYGQFGAEVRELASKLLEM